MRLLFISHGYPPHAMGGVEVYTQWLAQTLAARHEVTVFTTRSDPEAADLSLVEETRNGVRVVTVINQFRNYNPLLEVRHRGIEEAFQAFLERTPLDLVHCQHLIKLSAGLLDVCRARGLPTVLTLHDYWFICPLVHLLQRDHRLCPDPGSVPACVRCEIATSYLNREEAGTFYLTGMLAPMMPSEKWAALTGIYAGRFDPVYPAGEPGGPEFLTLRRGLIRRFLWERLLAADAVTAPSRFLCNLFARVGLPAERIQLLPNAVDTSGLDRRKRPAPPPPLQVLFLGTLTKHKGVHVLVEAANRLAPLPIEFTICGSTPDQRYEEYLHGLVRTRKLRFRGPYDRAELGELLATHHVVVVPSIWYENHPIVIREAFAAGVPVVASRLGALPEFVTEGVNGLLFPPGDPAGLAAALRRFLADPGLLGRLAAGIPPASDPALHLAALEGLYRQTRAGRPPAEGLPRRILLAGPSRWGTGFASALAELLVAGPPPWPEVLLWGEPGELEEPLWQCAAHLGLQGVLRRVATPAEAGPVDLAVALTPASISALKVAGFQIYSGPIMRDALAARLEQPS